MLPETEHVRVRSPVLPSPLAAYELFCGATRRGGCLAPELLQICLQSPRGCLSWRIWVLLSESTGMSLAEHYIFPTAWVLLHSPRQCAHVNYSEAA